MSYINLKGNGFTQMDDTMRIFLNDARRLSNKLTKREILVLVQSAKLGDSKAVEKLVNNNLLFFVSFSKRYNVRTLTTLDLVNEIATQATKKAIENFDFSLDKEFSTYLVHWCRHFAAMAVEKTSNMVRLPHNLYLQKVNNVAFSGDVCEDEENGTFFDRCVNDSIANGFDHTDYVNNKLTKLFGKLSEREQEIIKMSYGIGCREHTNYELAIKFGLTEERIRQIKIACLQKMKE